MIRLYASRVDPDAAYDPLLSAFQSSKQALVSAIARGRSWSGMKVYEERDDRLVEVVVEGEAEHMSGLLATLRHHGVGCLYLEADTEAELAGLEAEFSGFGAVEMELLE